MLVALVGDRSALALAALVDRAAWLLVVAGIVAGVYMVLAVRVVVVVAGVAWHWVGKDAPVKCVDGYQRAKQLVGVVWSLANWADTARSAHPNTFDLDRCRSVSGDRAISIRLRFHVGYVLVLRHHAA